MKRPIKTNIGPSDNSFIGKYIDTHYGIGRITHVTQDRVIFISDDGKENWTWRLRNGEIATFEIVAHNDKFTKALELKERVKILEAENLRLQAELHAIKKYLPIIQAIEDKAYDKFNR